MKNKHYDKKSSDKNIKYLNEYEDNLTPQIVRQQKAHLFLKEETIIYNDNKNKTKVHLLYRINDKTNNKQEENSKLNENILEEKNVKI